MARMNKISEEIGERHDRDKLTRLKEMKSSRFTQVLFAFGILLLIMLISFLLSCLGSKKKLDEGEEREEEQATAVKRVAKAD